MSQNAVYKAPL